MLPVVLTVIAGLVCILLGFRIGWRGDVHLIAGYDKDRIADPVGLGRLVGGTCVVLGLALVVMAGALVAWPDAEGILTFGYAVVVIVGIVVILVSRGRYERGPSRRRDVPPPP